jgi:hypothetical protein
MSNPLRTTSMCLRLLTSEIVFSVWERRNNLLTSILHAEDVKRQ